VSEQLTEVNVAKDPLFTGGNWRGDQVHPSSKSHDERIRDEGDWPFQPFWMGRWNTSIHEDLEHSSSGGLSRRNPSGT